MLHLFCFYPSSAAKRRLACLALGLLALLPGLAPAQEPRDDALFQAREAFQKRDKAKLLKLRQTVQASQHPLQIWVEYWELSQRIDAAPATEVQAFFARWPGSYLEDRLRNDWLLALGQRRDWATFDRELPLFRMNDDREVSCYALWSAQQKGQPVADAAQRAWMAQREADDGCLGLARSLYQAKQLPDEAVWRKLRLAVEINRLRLAREQAALLDDDHAKAVAELWAEPARYLKRRGSALGHARSELTALAIARLAAKDPDDAADALEERWAAVLVGEHAAWAWAQVAKQAAMALHPQALAWSRKAWAALKKRDSTRPDWSDDTLAWLTRAALRLGEGAERWQLVQRNIEAMGATERAEPTWAYWHARALLAQAPAGAAGDAIRAQARQPLQALSTQMHFYGQLAAEDLGQLQPLPARPAPASPAEREAARAQPNLRLALATLAAGLRPEAVKAWNFALIGMNDRELLAAAQWACEREVWDRCINTSDRSRDEIDLEQRFPQPLRNEVHAQARAAGLEPAYVYGLVRQESRFIMDARSHVGASGLMQVMPATAKYTAKRIGMNDYRPEMLTERDTNLRLGTAYLKLVLDDQDGSLPLAAAAYNAGPGRPRKWRNGPVLEPAMWIENIPFTETRDYVKKVLSNTTWYAALMTGKPASLKSRLGQTIGPRGAEAAAPDSSLP